MLAAMVQRYRATPSAELMRVPQFLSLLYAWRQGTDGAEVAEWVRVHTTTDVDLLAFLASVRSWSASSTFGIQYPLKRRDLEPFLDFDEAIRRLRAMSTNGDVAQSDRQKALELLDAAKMGNELA